jgi:hypothetical protein
MAEPPMNRRAVCALVLAAVASAAGRQADSLDALSADVLLARAGDYARRYEQAMATVVLEERYIQLIKVWREPPDAPDHTRLTWFDDLSKVRPDVIVKQRRQTKSDILLVQLPDRTWTAFRDTFEVNGSRRRERDDRLRDLFLRQTENSERQLRRINQASADWNLGGFYREINLPTTGLLFVHPRHQKHVTFRAGGIRDVGSARCRILAFEERSQTTIVQSVRGYNVPLKGDVCVDAAGVILQTRLDLPERHTFRGAMETTYMRHERADVLVPDRMWEWYVLPQPLSDGTPIYIETLATYSNLRAFTVTTSETVK